MPDTIEKVRKEFEQVIRPNQLRKDIEPVLIRIEDGKIKRPVRYVAIYFKDPTTAKPDPEKKSQLAWAVSGLPEGHKIHITAKPGTYFGYMDKESYEIGKPNAAVESGPVKKPTPPGGVGWSYGITLIDPDGVPLDSLDPDVHISND